MWAEPISMESHLTLPVLDLNNGVIGSYTRDNLQCTQTDVNAGLLPLFSNPGTWHGTCSLTGMLRPMESGPGQIDSCPCPVVDFRSNIWPQYPFLHCSIPSRLDTPHVTTVQISDGLLNSSPVDIQPQIPAVKLRSLSCSTQWCNPIGSEMMLNP